MYFLLRDWRFLNKFLADKIVEGVGVHVARHVVPLEEVEPRHGQALLSGTARLAGPPAEPGDVSSVLPPPGATHPGGTDRHVLQSRGCQWTGMNIRYTKHARYLFVITFVLIEQTNWEKCVLFLIEKSQTRTNLRSFGEMRTCVGTCFQYQPSRALFPDWNRWRWRLPSAPSGSGIDNTAPKADIR